MNMLIQKTQADAARFYYVAAVRRFFCAYQSKDCALAGAISSYKSDMFAGVDLQRGASEDVMSPIRLVYI